MFMLDLCYSGNNSLANIVGGKEYSRYCNMFYHIYYSSTDGGSLESGQKRVFEEALKIFEEWTYHIRLPIGPHQEIETWLIENCNGEFQYPGLTFEGDSYEAHVPGILFKDDDDVMAFKLVWS